MAETIEIELTDDELANYPSYGWKLRCCNCGSGISARIRAPEVDGIIFHCDVCKTNNKVRRYGNIVKISPSSGCISLLVLAVVMAVLANLFL